jgi:hypothetical protein
LNFEISFKPRGIPNINDTLKHQLKNKRLESVIETFRSYTKFNPSLETTSTTDEMNGKTKVNNLACGTSPDKSSIIF